MMLTLLIGSRCIQAQTCLLYTSDAESAAQALDQSYPKGYPTKTEIAEQSKNILTIGNSQKDLIQLKLRPEDVQCETQNRELFVDETETDAAIRECQKDCEEFVKATERANVQVRKEELERRGKLSRLFQAGEPSDQELRECKDKVRDLSQKQGELTLSLIHIYMFAAGELICFLSVYRIAPQWPLCRISCLLYTSRCV